MILRSLVTFGGLGAAPAGANIVKDAIAAATMIILRPIFLPRCFFGIPWMDGLSSHQDEE
jgi:hypothetical protein